MPFDNGRFTASREKLEDRRKRILSKRLMNQRKECQVPELALWNVEQRPMCMLSSGLLYYVMVPVSSPLQGPEPRNQAVPNIDGFKAISSTLAVFRSELPDNSDSVKLVLSGPPSAPHTLDQHENRNSLALSQSLLSNSLPTPLASDDSYRTVDGNLNTDASDFLVKDTTKVKKRVKRSPRKKGKKKGKQNKRTRSRKVSTKADVQDDKVPKTLLSNFADSTKDVQFEANIKFHNASSSPSIANSGSSSVVDSFHDGWNTDISANDSDDLDIMLTIKGSNGAVISCSKERDALPRTSSTDSCPVMTEISEESCITDPYWPNDVLDVCSILERAECSSQASSSDDFRPVVYGKRGRRARKITDNEKLGRSDRYFVEADNRVGKDAKTRTFRSDNSNIVSSRDDKPSKASEMIVKPEKNGKQQERIRSSCQYRYSDESHAYNIKSRQMVNTVKSAQILAKHTLGSFLNNVKYKQSSRSKSYDSMGSTNILDNHMIHNEAHQTSPVHHNKKTSSCLELKILSGLDSTQLSAEAHHCCKSGLEQKTGGLVSLGNNCTLAGNYTPSSYCDSDQLQPGLYSCSQMPESDSCVSLGDMCEDILLKASDKSPSLKLEIATSLPEGGNLQNSGSQVPKLDHVKRTLVVQDDTNSDSSRPSDVDETFTCILDSNSAKVPVSVSNKSSIYPSPDNGYIYSIPTSNGDEYLSAGSVQLTNKLRSFPHSTHTVKLQESLEFKDDLDKITQVVGDACKLQVAAEVVQVTVGSPIADYEKFLSSASPVIGQIHSSMSSAVCCQEQVVGRSQSSHCMRKVPLKNLWQWYEEPGCFGLEVKALINHKLKRSNNHVTEFDAYYVPYLSAVQLFGKYRSIRCCKCFGETVKTSGAHKTQCSMGSMFSLVPPQPCREVCKCLSVLSSCAENVSSDNPVKSNVDGRELLFEYFETDQPSWRRPLFEKIKDLINDQTSSSSQIFGSTETLESLNIQDLHPASWYSVAWYPIYRIPEGNIRAAFLTYHSLGHIVYRSLPCNIGSTHNVVCPVVGLQTYNDKGESWFQPRVPDSEFFESEEALCIKPSELVRERLRTLKVTASVMANAVISKSNKRLVNKHPDHDFFQSRS